MLLAEDGPRVIDFGISHAAEATMLTGTGLIFGSPAFMSPEQAKGTPSARPATCSAQARRSPWPGTGQGPFGTGSGVTVMYRVAFTPLDSGGLPAELRPLVERCLAKDPQQQSVI